MSKWEHFVIEEFACKGHECCGGQALMDSWFVTRLDILRGCCGFPLIVTSGYRCPEHNQKVSNTGSDGPHTTGKAVDLAVDRKQAYEVLRLSLSLGFTGIGVRQHGESRFLHLDMLEEPDYVPRPVIWSY